MNRVLSVMMVILAFAPAVCFAVDEGGIKIQDKWSVVGVISEDDQKGIVVLRNNVTKKTFTLAIGDQVPTEFGYSVLSAKNRAVTLTDGKQQVVLAFAEASSGYAEEEPGLSPTNRFLDNYYRGLSENPVEILGPAAENEPDRIEGSTGMMPLKRFGSLREDGRSRFDLYRADRMYRMNPNGEEQGQEEGEEDEAFVVNYDNFDDQVDDVVPADVSAPTYFPSEISE